MIVNINKLTHYFSREKIILFLNPLSTKHTRMISQILLFVCIIHWTIIVCQLNTYNTDRNIIKSNQYQFDCLNYRIQSSKLVYQELSDVLDMKISYCFRPLTNTDQLTDISMDSLSKKLSFEQIYMNDITVHDLFSWSIAIEVVERYQLYMNKPDAMLNEYFYNCTPPRFGLRCQYSFELSQALQFNEIVEADFHSRTGYTKNSPKNQTRMSCYVLIKCYRYGRPWCLDWREVCNGKIDCFDEALDEKFCFDMEVNQCHDDQYRCHDGHCISSDLWEDGTGETECLDRSDRLDDFNYTNSCVQDPTFRCEEHSCDPLSLAFPCGDGQCVLPFKECNNGRHLLLLESMEAKGNLADRCWMAMICGTGLTNEISEDRCRQWLMNNSLNDSLAQCEQSFEFPTVPIHSNFVYLHYENVHLKLSQNEILPPDYICYDEDQCDGISIGSSNKSLMCFQHYEQEQLATIPDKTQYWMYVMLFVQDLFQYCSKPYITINNKAKYNNQTSLYNCENSLKLISNSRLYDTIDDCLKSDDEYYENSCQLQDRYRINCYNSSMCWSPIARKTACMLSGSNCSLSSPISFEGFCDGVKRIFCDVNGEEYDDEQGCDNQICDNMYSRCDGYPSCSNGQDEYRCGSNVCPLGTQPCLSSINHTMICLSSDFIGDDRVNCIGALDEGEFCQSHHHTEVMSSFFRCYQKHRCLQFSQLCDGIDDCLPGREDEEFCKHTPLICDKNSMHQLTDIEQYICDLKTIEHKQVKFFSVYTSSNYPSLNQIIANQFDKWPTQNNNNTKSRQVTTHSWPWHCNRGLTVRTKFKNNSDFFECMCPPSYYGDRCQYQSERVSMSLKLSSHDRESIYAVVMNLISNDNIEWFEQFTYIVKETCTIKLHRYLLFPTRPKSTNDNYSIHIDVYDKTNLRYLGSWYFPISFHFLPVNRLGLSMNLSNLELHSSDQCSLQCIHGECTKYMNRNKSFCLCEQGWSGVQCNVSIQCNSCSSASLCIGSTNNHPICVCPINHHGPRCLLPSTCPINACQNNGRCLPVDIDSSKSGYACLCPVQFFGESCQYRKARLDVTLTNIRIPPYLVAYFFTLSNTSQPIETIVLRKISFFQSTVTFHVAVQSQLVFIEADRSFYLASLQQTPKAHITTSISSKQRCEPVEHLLDSEILSQMPYLRIPHFYSLCLNNHSLNCFVDKDYLCLCTNDHHANCLAFNPEKNFQCPSNQLCKNDGQCLQDHTSCPSIKICLCPDCFYGDRCQFYSKGMGTTLDEILAYEIKSNQNIIKQPIVIQLSAVITILLLIIGIINSILSILTFLRKASREVGCGIYLLVSCCTSVIIILLLAVKFWLLFSSHQDVLGKKYIPIGNCFIIEPLLKVFLYYNNWLNTFVAIERAISVIQGVAFNKRTSRLIAIGTTIATPVIIAGLLTPQLRYLYIFYDPIDDRHWCVVEYIKWIETYRTSFVHIHYIGPILINIVTMIMIITITAHQKRRAHQKHTYYTYIKLQIEKHKHILLSTLSVILLTLPYLVISSLLTCNRTSHVFWLSLIGYYLSFFPAAFVFFIYVIPSPLYRKEYKGLILRFHKRLSAWKVNKRIKRYGQS